MMDGNSIRSAAAARRRPTKVLKIAESFTNLDETARSRVQPVRPARSPRADVRKAVDSGRGGCGVSDGAPEPVSEGCSDTRVTGSSCAALRTAVTALYPFDDFNLEKIGAGFFSEVFKVTHKTSGQVMVLKMNQQRANRPNMLREVQLMNKLRHPNILGFMGVCVHEGQLHALTEYMAGGSLEQLLLGQPPAPLPRRARVKLAADMAAGLRYLHSLGVFHRDLTSKNVLLRKDEATGELTAIVADFGLASKIPHPTNGYRLPSVGSPWWMSPECLRGRWYDHHADIFSYGIILCQLIARVDADPDVLPRTDNFGLDYLAFVQLCSPDTLPELLRLAFNCCIFEPKARPLFPQVCGELRDISDKLQSDAPPDRSEEWSEGECGCISYGATATARAHVAASTDSITPHAHVHTLASKLEHRRSLSELEWCSSHAHAHTPPSDKARRHPLRTRSRHASASNLPPAAPAPRPAPPLALVKIAEIMTLKDAHYRPAKTVHTENNPFTALAKFRGVKKILEGEPGSYGARLGDLFSSCFELPSPLVRMAAACDSHRSHDDEHKCSSLPSSPGLSRRGSLDRAAAEEQTAHQDAKTQQSEPEKRQAIKYPLQLQKSNSSIELSVDGAFPAGLKGGGSFTRRRGSCESGIFSVVNEDFCAQHASADCLYGAMCPCTLMGCQRCRRSSKTDTASEHSCEEHCECSAPGGGDGREEAMCADCLIIYRRLFRPCRKEGRTQASSANSSLFVLDDSALSTTTVSSLRSLDDLDDSGDPHAAGSPFLCGQLDRAGSPPHRDCHILSRCCCAGGGRAARLGQLLYSWRGASSACTDSSDDIASLPGSDSLHPDYARSRHVRSAQISKIVEYFERKGRDFNYEAFKTYGSRFKMGATFASKTNGELLQFSKPGLRDVEGRDWAEGGRRLVGVRHRRELPGTETELPGCSGRKCNSQQRLLVCEGAVKSKLPLFDKKS